MRNHSLTHCWNTRSPPGNQVGLRAEGQRVVRIHRAQVGVLGGLPASLSGISDHQIGPVAQDLVEDRIVVRVPDDGRVAEAAVDEPLVSTAGIDHHPNPGRSIRSRV